MTVSKVLLVSLVPRALRAHLERTVTRARSESRARREAKPTRENEVPQAKLVSRECLELPALRAAMVRLGPEVSKACLARREMKDPEASLVYLDPLDCRDCLALRVRRVRTVTWVPWVHLVHPVREAPRAPAEQTVLKDLLAVLVQWVPMERREKMVKLVTQGPQERPAQRVPEEKPGRKASLVPPERLAPLAPADPRETTAPRETPVPLVSLEIPVLLESRVLVVWMA